MWCVVVLFCDVWMDGTVAPMATSASPHSVGSQSLWVRPPLLACLLLFSGSVGENVFAEN